LLSFCLTGSLVTKADCTYDRTVVVRYASQLQYDLFTEHVASGNCIVGTIRRQCI